MCRTLGGILADTTFSYTLEVSFFSFEVRTSEKDASAGSNTSANGAAPSQNGASPVLGSSSFSSGAPPATSTNGLSTSSTRRLNYTEEGYAKLGRNLARTFLAYYQSIGVVPAAAAAAALSPPPLNLGTGKAAAAAAAAAQRLNNSADQKQLDSLRTARGETSAAAASARSNGQQVNSMSMMSSARSSGDASRTAQLQATATSSLTPRQMNSARGNGFFASTSGSLLDSLLPPPGSGSAAAPTAAATAQGSLSRVRPLPNIPLSEQQQQHTTAHHQPPPQALATPDRAGGLSERPDGGELVAPATAAIEPPENQVVPEADAEADDAVNGEDERADAGGECPPEEEDDSSSDASEFA